MHQRAENCFRASVIEAAREEIESGFAQYIRDSIHAKADRTQPR